MNGLLIRTENGFFFVLFISVVDGGYTTNIKLTTDLFNIILFLTVIIENTFYTGFGLQKYFLSQIALMTSLSKKRTAKIEFTNYTRE